MALTHPRAIETWSGEPAVMSTEPGSEFSIFGGEITGRNMEFEENRKMVQQWYFDGQEEASVVSIKIHPKGAGSSVEVRHQNIPDEAFENISEGWTDTYFASVAEFLNE